MIYRRRANTDLARELITDKNIKNSLKELASMQIKDNLMGLQSAFDQEAGQQSQNQQGSRLKTRKNMAILKLRKDQLRDKYVLNDKRNVNEKHL